MAYKYIKKYRLKIQGYLLKYYYSFFNVEAFIF